MEYVCGIDTSLNRTSVTILDSAGNFVDRVSVGSAVAYCVNGRVRRYLGMVKQIVPVIQKCPPCVVAIEGYSMGSSGAQHSAIIEQGYEVRRMLARFEPTIRGIYEIAPPCLKKHATGHGNAEKAAMVSRMSRRFPDLTFNTDDEADSMGLALFALQIAGFDFPGNDSQRDSLAKVTNPQPKERKTRKPKGPAPF